MNDLDIRIAALAREYQAHVAQLSGRAAGLAAELAATQAQLEAAQKRVAELEKPAEAAKNGE
jgi:hypothetical protein